MKRSEKIKKIFMLILMGSLSGYFMYSGFSIILSDTDDTSTHVEKSKGQ